MRTRVLSAATLLTVLLAGCVTQPVAPTAAAIAAEVKPGDRIRLVTQAGSEGEYSVVRVDPSALYVKPSGRDGRKDPEQSIAYSDIREVTVTRPNKKAIGTGLGVAAVIVGAAMLSAAMEQAAAAALCC
jgi:hypothetical protein